MPSKREMQDHRREAIRNILMTSDPPIEDQKELLAHGPLRAPLLVRRGRAVPAD